MLARQMTIIRVPHVSALMAFALMALAVAWFLNTTLQAPLIPTDDAFITYRYAANLASGEGLVYNRGEYVLGTTAPGYAILLSIIARFTDLDLLPFISRWVNLAAILVTAGCAFMISRQIACPVLVSCAAFLIVVLSPATLTGVLSGMESPVFLALIALALLMLVMRRWRSAALLLGLLPLIRPEGVFVIAICGVIFVMTYRQGQISTSRRALVEALVLLLLPGITWAAFSTSYYGSPIPHSIRAKQAGVYPIGVIGSAIGTINGLADNFVNLNFIESPLIITSLGLFLTLFVFAILLSIVWLARQQPFLALIPLFALVMIVFYATSGTLVFGYYHANYDVFARVAWWVGLYRLLTEIAARSRNRPTAHRYALMLGTVALVAALFPALNALAASASPQSGGAAQRQLLYRDVANHLRPFLPEDTVILMPEIGELGFILDQVKVLDAAGLVSPEAIPYLPIPPEQRAGLGIGAIPVGLVHDYRPDMLIFFDIFAINGIGDDVWFRGNYIPVIVHEVNLPGWDSTALYVFTRSDFDLQLPVFTSSIR